MKDLLKQAHQHLIDADLLIQSAHAKADPVAELVVYKLRESALALRDALGRLVRGIERREQSK